jgi:hypothetical protein
MASQDAGYSYSMKSMIDKFGNKDSKSWTNEKKRKDHKALTQIIFCKIVCRRTLQLLYSFVCLKI